MKIKLIFFLLLLLFSCKRDQDAENDKSVFDNKNQSSYNSTLSNEYTLDISYKKLEMFLGKNFIPVFSLKTNIDNDAEEEFVIVYKKNNNSKISLLIFDLIKNEILKKRFEFETDIFHTKDFLIQTQNLFQKNNSGIVLEGKSSDNTYHLYIVSYLQDDYKIIGNFKGDFSVVIDYEEIDDEKGKYTKIKNITVITNAVSSVNTSTQKKEIFNWDIDNSNFKLLKSEIFLSTAASSIDQSILYSETDYFNYLKGIWYPEKYKKIIDSNSLNPNEFNDSNIRYLFLSNSPNEIGIKHGEYVDKYIIVKIAKLWNQKPGLRLVLKECTNVSDSNYTKSIDLTLLESNLLKVQGPEKFDDENYVRLSKSFVDYVNEKKEELIKSEITKITENLVGNYKSKDNITLAFDSEKRFIIKNKEKRDFGIYQINKNKDAYLIFFLFEEDNTILEKSNFLINFNDDKQYISLIPIKFNFNKIQLEELLSIDFYRM